MIVFELLCSERHQFEGWFASGDAFERQSSEGLIACPVCGTLEVRRVPSAKVTRPRTGARQGRRDETPAGKPSAGVAPGSTGTEPAKQMALAAFIDHVLANTEDVGDRFAEEARRIYYAEAARRSIRGQASRAETEELLEEGIPVLPLPIPPKDDWQ